MSYYDNPQWSGPAQNNWDHQGAAAPARTAGASGPQPQDDYAFSYQFDEVDRAYENLQKSGKGYGMGGRHSRVSQGGGTRSHATNNFDEVRGPQAPNLHSFYASQRHQPSRGTNEAEHFMQTKRRMAAQRERELRNRHTEQQYQRNDLAEAPQHGNKHMSEEETRELIARQRSALYGEGPFADKSSYVDESGNIRSGAPRPSGPSSIRGPSPLTFDGIGRAPSIADAGTPASASDHNNAPAIPSPRPQSTTSPQTAGPTNRVFDNAIGLQSRTSNSSPTGASPPQDLAPGTKPGPSGATVAPIGTRPSGTPSAAASGKRSTTPLTSPGGWGRGNSVWGQPSGLGAQASVWG
ncbi:hypothetical protein G6O67_000459 [Ophiocordyceps sinensis]|uniref:Uncharacterized protein n=2 Tax=Ophiocordyceps sinensis TaxID=72228 RepID=A0A8H4PZ81_9HYPO|nr:hypothetical protein OCS_00310 [Ophiocordyceps sinensis CO18]KAF4513151.1 hypothetical protein G6O67_000459 [Ophiocordyceps sinensis]